MGSPYHEKLLHWIWDNRQFRFQDVQTVTEKAIQIHNTGTLNKSDGADFLSADISIGGLRWYGNVELHWSLSDWEAHNHHTDANYNNVILHVVFTSTTNHSRRKDHTKIPTLCLAPYLKKPLQTFLNHYRQNPTLPCSGQLSFISEEVFAQQLQKAHHEYFEQKVNDLLDFYDSSLPPSQAWRKMFVLGLWDGLGISHNRNQMQQLGTLIWEDQDLGNYTKNELRLQALTLSGINAADNPPETITWNHKGCRPGNHPRLRIQQAAELLWHINQAPFEQWMQEDPKKLWENIHDTVDTKPGIGQERASILFGTVFLPTLYFLGNLFFNEQVKSRCWSLWQKHEAKIPSSLLKLLDKTAIPESLYSQKLGAIYQLRSYCRPRNCENCKIFKSVISS